MNIDEKIKAEKYLKENPLTFWEELSINRWTWIDFIAGKIKKGKYGFDGKKITKDFWKYKIKGYESLLGHLVNEKLDFAKKYMKDICRRIQVRGALKRGLITKENYIYLLDPEKYRLRNNINKIREIFY